MDKKNNLDAIQIALLYMLKQMKIAMSQSHFIMVIQDAEIIDYFYGTHYMGEFEEKGWVRELSLGGEPHYKITPKGIDICELHEGKLPDPIKQRITDFIDKILSGEHDMNKIYTKLAMQREGVWYFQCGVWESREPLFEIRVRSKDEDEVRRMMSFFRENALGLYEKTFELLGEKKDGE